MEEKKSKKGAQNPNNSTEKAEGKKGAKSAKSQQKQQKKAKTAEQRYKAEIRRQALKEERQSLREEKRAQKAQEREKSKAEKQQNREKSKAEKQQNRQNSKTQKAEKRDRKKATREQHREEKREKRQNSSGKANRGAVIGLAIATGVLGLSNLGLAIGYSMTSSQANDYALQLENVYRKNYYELADSVNSTDTNLSKLLASDSEDYQAELLTEISSEASQMQANIASLPLTGESVMDCVRFVNQLSGYTQTLQEKLASGESLDEDDLATLQELHAALTEMKEYFNELTTKIMNGYSIMSASRSSTGDLDEFSKDFMGFNNGTAEYPTMIYDGPFSDSVTNSEIVGLTGDDVSRDEAAAVIDEVFKNISSLTADGVTEGKFDTFNFTLTNTDDLTIFVQVTKIGGHILTISGSADSDAQMIDIDQAETIAIQFAKDCGIENPEVVWSDSLNNQTYLNIAPMQDEIVLYPDLVKVKIDMNTGDVIGYDAVSYYTNHTERDLATSGIGIDLARESVDDSFTVTSQRVALVPLEYNREVVCYEFVATRDGATYYLYYNIESGELENVLKVLETDDGNKLM